MNRQVTETRGHDCVHRQLLGATGKLGESQDCLERQSENLDTLRMSYKKARRRMTKEHGSKHLSTLQIQHEIAVIYERKRNFTRAIIIYKYVFDVNKKERGNEDPLSVKAIEGLARCFQVQDNHPKASKWVRKLSEVVDDQLNRLHI